LVFQEVKNDNIGFDAVNKTKRVHPTYADCIIVRTQESSYFKNFCKNLKEIKADEISSIMLKMNGEVTTHENFLTYYDTRTTNFSISGGNALASSVPTVKDSFREGC